MDFIFNLATLTTHDDHTIDEGGSIYTLLGRPRPRMFLEG
jgi:hypothetical protein